MHEKIVELVGSSLVLGSVSWVYAREKLRPAGTAPSFVSRQLAQDTDANAALILGGLTITASALMRPVTVHSIVLMGGAIGLVLVGVVDYKIGPGHVVAVHILFPAAIVYIVLDLVLNFSLPRFAGVLLFLCALANFGRLVPPACRALEVELNAKGICRVLLSDDDIDVVNALRTAEYPLIASLILYFVICGFESVVLPYILE